MDLTTKRYVVTKLPESIEEKKDSYNIYRYLSANEDICVKEHYDNEKLTMVYLCYGGIPATLGTMREEIIKSLVDPDRWDNVIREDVSYFETEDGTVFVSKYEEQEPVISKITLKSGSVKDYKLESGFEYTEVENTGNIVFDIWKRKVGK